MYLIEDVTTDECSLTRERRDSCVCVKVGVGGCPGCWGGWRGARGAPPPFQGEYRHIAPLRKLPPPIGRWQQCAKAQRACTPPSTPAQPHAQPLHHPKHPGAHPPRPPPLRRETEVTYVNVKFTCVINLMC